ncbi:MAG: hypothetical protein ABR562_08325 [Thermoplasmatota archaeon]|nr:hypothetical protein [Halobacteriales archaeon]
MPRLRAVWAVAQFFLTIAAAGWGLYLLATTHEAVWASGNLAAAVFFLVTVFLFAANHPDGRIVGMFGIAIFVVTNALLIVALFQDGGLPRLSINADWTKAQVALLMAGMTTLVAIPEALLLLFGHGPARGPGEPLAGMPPS